MFFTEVESLSNYRGLDTHEETIRVHRDETGNRWAVTTTN